jgi:hypothetical protein
MIAPVGTRSKLVGGVLNFFDLQYADPVSDQHRQDSIGNATAELSCRVALGKVWSM